MPSRYHTPKERAYRKTVHEDSRWKRGFHDDDTRLRECEKNLRDA